ncbi:MAG: PEGA domain-containing protein [Acidobacteriota bacterium]|nr:PEGA domain-containing protein [Acidobacteriota bacterium]
MSVPPVDLPASLSASGYEDGLGRRTLLFDRETGGILERLHLRPEFAAFERAIRERMDAAAGFDDERFANARSIERDPRTGGVSIVSEFVPGNRLSDLLEGLVVDGAEEAVGPGLDAALGFLLEVLPALTALHQTTGFTHGAMGPGRTVVTPAGEVVLLDWMFAQALERLRLDRRRLWRDFRIAMPGAAGASKFDMSADLAQAALTGVMIVIGRPLRIDEYPDGVTAIASEVVEVAQIRGSSAFATGLQRFLHRALRLPGSRPFPSVEEADTVLRQLAEEIGVSHCRAALGAFVSEFNGVRALDTEEAGWDTPAPASRERAHSPLTADDEDAAEYVSAALEVEIELDDVATRRRVEDDDLPYDLSLTEGDQLAGGGLDEQQPSASVSEPDVAEAAQPPQAASPPETFDPLPEAAHSAAAARVSFNTHEPVEEAAPATAWEPAPAPEPAPTEAASGSLRTTAPSSEWTVSAAPVNAPQAPDIPPAAAVAQPQPPAPPQPPPKEHVSSRQKRRGAKRDRDKLRSIAKPAAAPVPPSKPAPAPPPTPAAPAMPYYPPVFDPREPASSPAVARVAMPAHLAGVPAAPPPQVAPAVRMKSEPPALRMKSQTPAGYAPPARRGALHESADTGPQAYARLGGPRLSPTQWKIGAAAALLLAVGAGAYVRPYLIDRPQAAAAAAPKRVAPKPVPAAAAAVGSLSLVTQPPGARVLLDGTAAGETPLTLESVPAGRHTVTFVTAAGSVKKNIRIEAGKTTSLDVPVYSGWVAVFAPVLLDIAESGRSIGTSEGGRLMLAPGRHQLTFSNRELGYTSAQTVDIEPGEERTVNLQPTGEVNLNAIPWAEVWIDGQKTGDTPVANLRVPLGTHEILFKHPQFGERKVTATVRADAPTAATVDFTKQP